MAEIPKAYEPQLVEDKWYAWWQERGIFRADETSGKPAYSIVIPPPNVTGVLTLGHVLNNTIQDILCRRARQKGCEVLWLPGTDHAGIATQTVVERKLRKEEKKTRHDLGREAFLERVWEWKEKHGGIIIQQLKKLGCSCDWGRERFTMDAEYSRRVQEVFVDLYNKGLIYRGRRMVNWCPVSLTALSDEEVIPKAQKGYLYHFKVEIVERPGTFLEIATTRPETIMGDTAVAVNPNDPRYRDFIGLHIRRPLPVEERAELPIVGDEAVEFEFGTGVLKVTPAHDKTDYEIGLRHGLPVVDIMNPDGTLNELAGEGFVGLDRFEARVEAVERLREMGLLVKEEPHENHVGFSERADVPIEPRLSEQWFLRYPKTAEARAAVRDGRIRFFPERWEKVYDHWLENIQDWCISRQLWWGHRIPVWRKVGQASSLSVGNDRRQDACATTGAEPGDLQELARTASNVQVGQASSLSVDSDRRQDACATFRPFRGFDELGEIDVSRRHLPHWEQEGATYFVTFRLADSLPSEKLVELEAQREAWLAAHPAPWSEHQKAEYQRLFTFQIEEWLDAGAGECLLGNEVAARIVADTLQHFEGERYTLGAWVVMPNHVHAIVTPAPGFRLGDILHSWKSYSSNAINTALARSGSVWQSESYDHIVRDGAALHRISDYINSNPANAGINVGQASSLSVGNDRRQDACATTGAEPGDLQELARTTSNVQVGQASSLSVDSDRRQDACATGKDFTVSIESPGEGWVQDPDVLDTWFSSWLWAHDTMDSATRAKFYPTSALVTGPDIIFFWVARMIMAGLEYEGEIPFREVYFTGIIRDRQGRKMSKSLGNSPDPLDLIAKYGADGLRFGLLRIAPQGQDIKFDEQQIVEGRNFCNKLWNACRFRLLHGPVDPAADPSKHDLSIFAQDLLAKLDATILKIEDGYAAYRFSEIAQALYDFVWGEFCDRFIEVAKADLAEGSPRRDGTLAAIDHTIRQVLRLLHPYAPFVAEELWHGLGFGTGSISEAGWPEPLGITSDGLATVLYDAASHARNLRATYNLPSNKRLPWAIEVHAPWARDEFAVLATLLHAESIAEVNAPVAGAAACPTGIGTIYLPLEGLVDPATEKKRLDAEIAKVGAEIQKAAQKLASESFVQNAPPEVVAEHRQREKDWIARMAELERARAALG